MLKVDTFTRAETSTESGIDACDGRVNGTESWKDETKESTISSGKVSSGGRIKEFEDEVVYGDDRVLGALSVEFEGEDINMSDLTFDLKLSGFEYTDPDVADTVDNSWEEADEDTVSIDNIQLRVDGKNVLFADDNAEF